MEFLIHRYDPHPAMFKPHSPTSYNARGAKFTARLSPATLGNPTRTEISSAERAQAKVFHKGGWAGPVPSVHDSPPKGLYATSSPTSASSPEVGVRGGWPTGGSYSREGGSWFTDSPPRERPRASLGYNWQHRQFVRAAA